MTDRSDDPTTDSADETRSTLPADTDLDELRDGGPTRSEGAMTTTGGTAGPASTRRLTNRDRGEKVAPTSTGDAGSGGMTYPASGPTSDGTTDSVTGTEQTD